MSPRTLMSALVFAFASIAACSSHDYKNPCPTQGTFVVDAALDGTGISVDGFPPLSSGGVGACIGTNPSDCQPTTQQLTLTLNGSTTAASETIRRLTVQWTNPSSASGTCDAMIMASGDVSLGSADGSTSDSTFCDLTVGACAGAAFDGVGLRIGIAGPYARMIQASLTEGSCCWEGSAAAQ